MKYRALRRPGERSTWVIEINKKTLFGRPIFVQKWADRDYTVDLEFAHQEEAERYIVDELIWADNDPGECGEWMP
jgi:hypothetical protein